MNNTPCPATLVIGHLQENNLVSVNLGYGIFRVGNDYFDLKSNNQAQIIDLNMIDEVFKITNSTAVNSYENPTTGEKISRPDYVKMEQELLDHRSFDEDGDAVWTSIQNRHAWELFQASWNPIVTPIVFETQVIIKVQGEAPKTDNEFIIPIRKLSGDLTNTLYRYQ